MPHPAKQNSGGATPLYAPSRPMLDFVKEQWKWLITFLLPLGFTAGYLSLPASNVKVDTLKTEAASNLERVRVEAAANLALAKTEIVGKFEVVKTQLDTLSVEQAATGKDIKELLSRIPLHHEPAQVAAQQQEPQFTPEPEKKPKPVAQKRRKPAPPVQTGLLGWIR